MLIRKHDVKEVVSPVSIGLGRELTVGTLMVCLKGGRSPLMALQYQGRYVKMEISEARMRGNIRTVPMHLLPKKMKALCGLDTAKPREKSVRAGSFATLTKTVRAGEVVIPVGSLGRVVAKRSGASTIQTLVGGGLTEIQVPDQVLEPAAPIEERLTSVSGLSVSIELDKDRSVRRLAYKGVIDTPEGSISVESDGETSPMIAGDGFAYLKGVLEDELARLGGQAQCLGCPVQRYAEFAATVRGLLGFSEYIDGLLGRVSSKSAMIRSH